RSPDALRPARHAGCAGDLQASVAQLLVVVEKRKIVAQLLASCGKCDDHKSVPVSPFFDKGTPLPTVKCRSTVESRAFFRQFSDNL
ncbi:MAG: hypothetical protein D6694_05415, partial [Gammaproteobacteria bacterium]